LPKVGSSELKKSKFEQKSYFQTTVLPQTKNYLMKCYCAEKERKQNKMYFTFKKEKERRDSGLQFPSVIPTWEKNPLPIWQSVQLS
jgi:hypothetical protein